MSASTRTPGSWRPGRNGAIVTDVQSPWHDDREPEYYGGYLVAESIRNPADEPVLAAAPDMYEALQAVDNALAHNLPHGVMRRVQAALAKAEGREVPAGA